MGIWHWLMRNPRAAWLVMLPLPELSGASQAKGICEGPRAVCVAAIDYTVAGHHAASSKHTAPGRLHCLHSLVQQRMPMLKQRPLCHSSPELCTWRHLSCRAGLGDAGTAACWHTCSMSRCVWPCLEQQHLLAAPQLVELSRPRSAVMAISASQCN